MEILVAFIIVTATIWGAVSFNRLTPLMLAMVTISIGSILGPEFYSTKVGPLPLTIDRLLWGCLGLNVLVVVLCRKKNVPVFGPIDFVLMAFLAVVGISTITHDWTRDENLPLARFLFFQLIPVSFFWIGRNIKVNPKEIVPFALIGVGFGIYLAVTGICEKFGMHAFVFPRYIISSSEVEFFGRARGPFINPIGCGIALIFCLGCLVLLWKNVGLRRQAVLGIVAPVMMIGVYCTMTRSVWLAFLVSAAVAVWFTFPMAARGALIASGSAFALVFVLFLSPYLNDFKRDKNVTAEQMSKSISLRPMLMAVALDMARDKPFTGHGYAQYKPSAGKYHRTNKWGMPLQTVRSYVQHNVFLAYLAEIGLIGLSLGIAVFGCFAWNSICLLRNERVPLNLRLIGLIALIVTISLVINGMFHDVSLIVSLGSIFYLINGLAYSVADEHSALETENHDTSKTESVDSTVATTQVE